MMEESLIMRQGESFTQEKKKGSNGFLGISQGQSDTYIAERAILTCCICCNLNMSISVLKLNAERGII